jgi:hypothetical protein
MSSKAIQSELEEAFPGYQWEVLKHDHDIKFCGWNGRFSIEVVSFLSTPSPWFSIQYGNSALGVLLDVGDCGSLADTIAVLKASAKAQADALREIAGEVADES